MTAPSPAALHDLPLATLRELVAQYHHRMLGLEAELRDSARRGQVPPKAMRRRIARLKAAQQNLLELQRLCMVDLVESRGASPGADLGLPLSEDCSDEERNICARFLKAKETELTALASEAAEVLEWVTEAVAGRLGPMRLTLRLSRLRGLLTAMDRRQDGLKDSHGSVAEQIQRLLEAVGLAKTQGSGPIDGLAELFEQVENTTTRIARLKGQLKELEAKTRSMSAWLAREEQALTAKRAPMSAPTPLALAQVLTEALGPYGGSRTKARRRALLSQFFDEVVGVTAVRATRAAAGAAAGMLRDALQTKGVGGPRRP